MRNIPDGLVRMDFLISNKDIFVARYNNFFLVHAENAPARIRPLWVEQVRDPTCDDNARLVPLHGRYRVQLLNILAVRHCRLQNLSVVRLELGFFLLTVVCCGNGQGPCECAMPSSDLDGRFASNASSKEFTQFFCGEAVQAVAHAEQKPFLRRRIFKNLSRNYSEPAVVIQQQARNVSHARSVGEVHVHGAYCCRTAYAAITLSRRVRRALTVIRCLGLAKNAARLTVMFELSNLWMVRRKILGAQG